MKNIIKFSVISIFVFAVLVSCGNPVTGMWIENVEGENTASYWINFNNDNSFDFIVLSGPYKINVFYTGTYEVNAGDKTITLTASEETDGSEDEDTYSWSESSWTQTVSYSIDGENLVLTLEDDTEISLVTREQPVQIQRAITSAE
ncbi:MAG: hypothetical protein ACLFR1_13625 [Spirochaetia bacterium]